MVRSIRAQGFANVNYLTWFEYGGGPYRFRLEVTLASDEAWTRERDSLLVRTAIRAKSVRSRLESLRLTRRAEPGPVCIGGALFLAERTKILLDAPGDIVLPPGPLRIGGVTIIHERIVQRAA